jgi:hypothetical protein
MYDMYTYGEESTVTPAPEGREALEAVQVSLDRRDNGGYPSKVAAWQR